MFASDASATIARGSFVLNSILVPAPTAILMALLALLTATAVWAVEAEVAQSTLARLTGKGSSPPVSVLSPPVSASYHFIDLV